MRPPAEALMIAPPRRSSPKNKIRALPPSHGLMLKTSTARTFKSVANGPHVVIPVLSPVLFSRSTFFRFAILMQYRFAILMQYDHFFKVSEAEMRQLLSLESELSVKQILLYRGVAR